MVVPMTGTSTTHGARDHARAQGGAGRGGDADPAGERLDGELPAGVDRDALTWAETVAGGGYTHKVLARGTTFRLDDLAGDACAHVLVFNAARAVRAAQRRRHREDPVAGLPRSPATRCCRTRAGCSRRSSTTPPAATTRSAARRTDAWNERALRRRLARGRHARGPRPFVLAAGQARARPARPPAEISFFQGVRVEADGDAAVRTARRRRAAPSSCAPSCRSSSLVANVPHPLDPRDGLHLPPLRVTAWRGEPTGPDDPLGTPSPEATGPS